MIYKNIKLKNFSLFKDFSIDLDRGLNVVYGPNEKGKSSILKGISSILFGINKSDRSILRRKAVLQENMEDFSGELTLQTDNDLITFKRNFDSDTVKVYQGDNLIFTGDISRGSRSTEKQYYADILKKYLLINSPALFNHTFFIEQGQIDHAFNNEDITIIKDAVPKRSELKYSDVLNKILEEYYDISKIPPDYIGGRGMNKDRKLEIAYKRKEKIETTLLDNEQKFKKLYDLNCKLKDKQSEKNRIELLLDELEVKMTDTEKKQKAAETTQYLAQELKLYEAKYEQVAELEKQRTQVQDDICEEEAAIPKGFILETAIAGVVFGLCIAMFFILPSLYLIWTSTIVITLLSYLFICYNNYKEKRRKEKHNAKLVLEQERLNDLISQFPALHDINLKIDELDHQIKEMDLICEHKTVEQHKIDLEQLKKQIKSNESAVLSLTREIAEISGYISTLETEVESLASIYDDIEDIKREISELERKKTILGFSAMYLSRSIDSYISKFVDRIAESTSDMISYICNDKYTEFKVDSALDFELKTSSGLGFSSKALSYGTKDLSWFVLRFVLAKMIMGDTKLPLFLDDPFVHIDEKRRFEIFEYLMKESNSVSQLVLFTHDPWYIKQDWQAFESFSTRSL